MIVAVMPRVTRGHTGRELTADQATVAMFVLINAAALARVASWHTEFMILLLLFAGACWIAVFAVFRWSTARCSQNQVRHETAAAAATTVARRRDIHSRSFDLSPSSASSRCSRPTALNVWRMSAPCRARGTIRNSMRMSLAGRWHTRY
jgi:NnrS protein